MPPTQLAISNSPSIAGLLERVGELSGVVADDRIERGVDRGRDGAAVFARDRVEFMAERDRDARQFLGKDLAHSPLMGRVDDRPQQADRDRLDSAGPEVAGGRPNIVVFQRLDLVAHGIDPAAHLAGPAAGHEGRRKVDLDVEGALARRFAQGQDIGVAGVADQPGRGDLAFDQRIG